MYLSATAMSPSGMFVVVDLRTGEATRLFEARDFRVDEVGHHVRDEFAAARLVHRDAVERRPEGLAQVDVGERAMLVVDGDVVVAGAG